MYTIKTLHQIKTKQTAKLEKKLYYVLIILVTYIHP